MGEKREEFIVRNSRNKDRNMDRKIDQIWMIVVQDQDQDQDPGLKEETIEEGMDQERNRG